jgi:N-acetylglucosaminyl-diphospho-decaprenol L-rhamnosyltransferase
MQCAPPQLDNGKFLLLHSGRAGAQKRGLAWNAMQPGFSPCSRLKKRMPFRLMKSEPFANISKLDSSGRVMADLGIVIVSWNVRDLLAACLESVIASLSTLDSSLSTEIIVIDNASTDGSADMVRGHFPQVKLIISERNLGFAGGNNAGIRYWGLDTIPNTQYPRFVLLLNPDTVVHGDALETMVRFMDATPRAGVCGARLIYGDGRFQHSAFGFPGLWQIVLDAPGVHPRLLDSRLNGRYSRKRYAAGQPFEVDHPLGASMLVRAEAIRQVGLMDEGFHIYCEEIDWSWRIKKAGWKIFCMPQAEIVHYGGQSTRQVKPEMIVALWTSRLRLYRKHYPAWKLAAAKWLVRRKMQGEVRRAGVALSRQEIDGATYAALIGAYQRVIELFARSE